MSQYLTLVNRTTKDLNGTWNGRQYKIAPGKHEFPEHQALKFKEQNVVMGSENPYTLEKQYLIGIVEYRDDCTPIEQSNAVERIDRSLLPQSDTEFKIVPGNGLYAPGRDAAPLPSLQGLRGAPAPTFSKDE